MALFSSQSQNTGRWRWGIPLALLGAFIVFAKLMNTNPPTKSAQTSPGNPDLKTRLYEVTPEAAARKIESLAVSTYGRSWKVLEENHISANEIQLVFHVPVLVFTDILTVTIKRKDGETTQVNVESHSQIGQGDFGENRRHIRQLLAAMDKAFA